MGIFGGLFFFYIKNMQRRTLEQLGLSHSIIEGIEPENPKESKLDYGKMGALFVKYMSRLLRQGEPIGTIKMELPEYIINISKVDNDIVVMYTDKQNNVIFTVDKSKKAIYESLASLYESGIFD